MPRNVLAGLFCLRIFSHMKIEPQISDFLTWDTASIGVTASQVFDSSTTGRTPNNYRGVTLTNCSGNTIYVGPDNTVTSSKFMLKLAAGEERYLDASQIALAKHYAIASGANSTLSVAGIK